MARRGEVLQKLLTACEGLPPEDGAGLLELTETTIVVLRGGFPDDLQLGLVLDDGAPGAPLVQRNGPFPHYGGVGVRILENKGQNLCSRHGFLLASGVSEKSFFRTEIQPKPLSFNQISARNCS